MRIKLINPNTTQSMTDGVQRVAERAAAPGTEVYSVSPQTGPACVENLVDQYICVPGLLEEIIKGEAEGADAYIVACFGDPGLKACRCVTDKPVIGIAEAAIAYAKFLAPSFSFMSNESCGDETEREIIAEKDCQRQFRSCRAIGLSILEVEQDYDRALEALKKQCKLAIEEDHAECIILTCAGFAPFAHDLEKCFPIPVLDGVSPAVKIAEGMVELGKRTSKVKTWSYPKKKDIIGFDFLDAVMKEV